MEWSFNMDHTNINVFSIYGQSLHNTFLLRVQLHMVMKFKDSTFSVDEIFLNS